MATTTTPKKTTTRRPAASKPKTEPAPEPEEVLEAELVDEPGVDSADEMTASERAEAIAAQQELYEELLGDMPPLRAPERFRFSHRTAFTKLMTGAISSGVFEGDGRLEFDLEDPADARRYEAFLDFVSSIDEWAESIAEDPESYAEWSVGKTADHFMTLFTHYRDALGESRRSES
ncbi:hypothetical protein O1W71_01935 [Microbacterium sp. H37-C3]|uniref:hypothetical protein n=1 Tax=Microbacterium sp. H37-C3 TaxID=3004354 RepID=UPI0022AEBF01|nr:hypothetical protein [Microbacterium sp. H37-C3]MCZ4066428.1 hypothetical protein [Microbacterium sp. H37-C3]